ncbi:MAG: NUDIX domain-containing protein [Anaerolineae bacterium]|nr:NUDIX domain-containing protein [Anaerolineae bacterium]
MIGRFYGGIGAVILSPAGEYLLLKRSAEKDFAAGVWECVTGRVDQGEGFEEAVRREVQEELGAEVRIDLIVGTTHFYRGEAVAENELIGVVYACTLEEPGAIRVSAEHSEARWVTAEEALALLAAPDGSTHWMRRVIKRVEAVRRLLPGELGGYYHEVGFELG